MRRATVAAVVLLVAGCGEPTPAARPSSSPAVASGAVAQRTPTTPSSSTPSVAPVGGCGMPWSPNQRVVLATLTGTDQLVIRDESDINNPRTLCSMPNPGNPFGAPRFAGPGEVAYVSPGGSDEYAGASILVRDLTTGAIATAVTIPPEQNGFGSWSFAFSPDGSVLTYITVDTQHVYWHLRGARGDAVVATLPPVPGRGVSADEDDLYVGFSADGSLVALDTTFSTGGSGETASLQVRHLDGSLAYAALGIPRKAVWLGRSLFFRYAGDTQVYVWSGGPRGVPAFTTKAEWLSPAAGVTGELAWDWRDSSGLPHVSFSYHGGSVDVPSIGRAAPVFVSEGELWYQGEAPCNPCGLGPPSQPNGKSYIYGIEAGSESPSVLIHIFDAWPRLDA